MWLIYAFLSAIFAALVAIFGKIGLKDVDSTTATAIRAFFMFLFLFGAVVFAKKLPMVAGIISSKPFLYIILSGIAGALSWFFYFLALKIGDASKVVSIDRLSIIFVVILAALFLGEKFSLKLAFGAILMAVGAILITL